MYHCFVQMIVRGSAASGVSPYNAGGNFGAAAGYQPSTNASISVAKSNSLRHGSYDDATSYVDGANNLSTYNSSAVSGTTRYSAYQPPPPGGPSSPSHSAYQPRYDGSMDPRLHGGPSSPRSAAHYDHRPASEYAPRSPNSLTYRGPPGDPRDFRDYRDGVEYGRAGADPHRQTSDYELYTPGLAYHRGNGSLPRPGAAATRTLDSAGASGRVSIDPGRGGVASYGAAGQPPYHKTNGTAGVNNGYPVGQAVDGRPGGPDYHAAPGSTGVLRSPAGDSLPNYDRVNCSPAQPHGSASATQQYDRVSRSPSACSFSITILKKFIICDVTYHVAWNTFFGY